MVHQRARYATSLAAAAIVMGSVLVPGATAQERRPDLIVASVARPPGFKEPGQNLQLKTTVKNAGNARAAGSVTRYYLSKNGTKGASDIRLTGQLRVGALAAGAKSVETVALTVPSSAPPFLYQVIACADDKKEVPEKDERNNCKTSAGRMLVEGPEEAADPLTVWRTLEPAGSVTEEIDKDAGGSLTTSGLDGTQYTLNIPPNALDETTEVTMTPVGSLTGSSDPFEFDGGIGGGVELKPHGLTFYEPAELSIEPASPPEAGTSPLGFAYGNVGMNFHMHPWRVEGSTIVMNLTHFSGVGFGNASPADASSLPEYIPVNTHPEFSYEHSIGELISMLEAEEITGEQFADLASEVFIKHFYRHIVPALGRALLPTATEDEAWQAFNSCNGWARQGELLGISDHVHTKLKIKMRTLWEFCLDQYPKIAKIQFDQADQRCSRVPPINPPEQVRIMVRWSRLSDLMLGGAEKVLGADYMEKIQKCIEKIPTSVQGTLSYKWTRDSCFPDDSDGECGGQDHREESGTLKVYFTKRSPSFCCDWDDAAGSYDATSMDEMTWVSEHSGPDDNICDNSSESEAGNTQDMGPGSTVSLDLTFVPTETNHDVFVHFSDYVEEAQSSRTRRFNCASFYTGAFSSTGATSFWSNDCPFREDGVPRTPGLMGTYDPDTKKIDMSCTDDATVDGEQLHIEVTGTLEVVGGL